MKENLFKKISFSNSYFNIFCINIYIFVIFYSNILYLILLTLWYIFLTYYLSIPIYKSSSFLPGFEVLNESQNTFDATILSILIKENIIPKMPISNLTNLGEINDSLLKLYFLKDDVIKQENKIIFFNNIYNKSEGTQILKLINWLIDQLRQQGKYLHENKILVTSKIYNNSFLFENVFKKISKFFFYANRSDIALSNLNSGKSIAKQIHEESLRQYVIENQKNLLLKSAVKQQLCDSAFSRLSLSERATLNFVKKEVLEVVRAQQPVNASLYDAFELHIAETKENAELLQESTLDVQKNLQDFQNTLKLAQERLALVIQNPGQVHIDVAQAQVAPAQVQAYAAALHVDQHLAVFHVFIEEAQVQVAKAEDKLVQSQNDLVQVQKDFAQLQKKLAKIQEINQRKLSIISVLDTLQSEFGKSQSLLTDIHDFFGQVQNDIAEAKQHVAEVDRNVAEVRLHITQGPVVNLAQVYVNAGKFQEIVGQTTDIVTEAQADLDFMHDLLARAQKCLE